MNLQDYIEQYQSAGLIDSVFLYDTIELQFLFSLYWL